MNPRRLPVRFMAVGVVLFCLPALSACKVKDSPARTYIRDELEPYLDSLAYQLCVLKSATAPQAPGQLICPGPPEGYKKPPGNGAP